MRLALLTATLVAAAACSTPASPDVSSNDAADIVVADASMDGTRDDAATDAPVCTFDAHATYPDGPYGFNVAGTIPDLHFTDAGGHDIALHDYFTPCVAPAPVLIVRVMAAWSSLARQAASHTNRYRTNSHATRMRMLDLLVRSQDNVPAAVSDLASWRSFYDVEPDALAVDPAYQIPLDPYGPPMLPVVLVIDTSRMQIADAITPLLLDSAPLDHYLDAAFARLDGTPVPRVPMTSRVDDRFMPDEWELVRAMSSTAPPADPTNAHADDPAAAVLGERLFDETLLSSSGHFACMSCHQHPRHFTDGLPTAMTVATGNRNTPSVAMSSYTHWVFWDGRADSLWAQAVGPIENPIEMAGSRLAVAHVIADHYAAEYEAIFGALPPLADTTRFPLSGRPGDAAYDAMSAADRDAVTRVFVNVGKSLEAFERTLRPPEIALDRYIAGNYDALTAQQRDGLREFVTFGCVQCHYGPALTDDSFHNIGMGTGRQDGMPDRGRIDVIEQLLANPFRATGSFSDSPASDTHLAAVRSDPTTLGQFHTPSLRGTAVTGPWGHGGTFATLREVVVHYGSRAVRPPVATTIGPLDPHLPGYDTNVPTYVDPMTAFLQTLNAP